MSQIGREMHFYHSEELAELYSGVLPEIRRQITSITQKVEIYHIGGGSIPGSYTKGDLDIQVRIAKEDYSKVTQTLSGIFEPNNLELWDGELAIFRDRTQYPCKIDILVTVVDSKNDDCFRLRDLLISNPELLAEYNTLKLQFEGGDSKKYKKAKDRFYEKLKRVISS